MNDLDDEALDAAGEPGDGDEPLRTDPPIRRGADDHERLIEVARLFSMRPSALARALTVRGVDRARYEERRERHAT